MSDDELALLRGAAANPDDDLPRLVYADWLDDHGRHDQAEFVRVQVRRSRLEFSDPERLNLLEEERISQQLFGRKWNGPVHRWLAANGLGHKVDSRRGVLRGWQFHRGMVGRVSIRAVGLTAVSPLVFTLGPIACLHLDRWPWNKNEVKAVFPLLAKSKSLHLQSGVGPLVASGASAFPECGSIPILDLRETTNFVHSPRFTNWLVNQHRFEVVRYRFTHPDGVTTRIHDPLGKWSNLQHWYADLTSPLHGNP